MELSNLEKKGSAASLSSLINEILLSSFTDNLTPITEHYRQLLENCKNSRAFVDANMLLVQLGAVQLNGSKEAGTEVFAVVRNAVRTAFEQGVWVGFKFAEKTIDAAELEKLCGKE